MKASDLMFIGGGLIVILGLAWLVSPYFQDVQVLWLDSVVLFIAYLIAIFSAGILFMSSGSFRKNITSTGIFLWTSKLYTIFVILGILIGFFADIPAKWQLYYQVVFFLLLCLGAYAGKCAAERLERVADASGHQREEIESLAMNIQRLKSRLELEGIIDVAVRDEINKLNEKAGYLSVPTSPMAKELEMRLKQQLGVIFTDMEEKLPASQLGEELAKANRIMSERLKQY